MKLFNKLELRSSPVRFWGLWILAGFCEAPLFFIIFFDQWFLLNVWFILGLHILSSVLLLFAPAKEGGWFNSRRHWIELYAIWTLLIPVIGWWYCGVVRFVVFRFTQIQDPAAQKQLDHEDPLFEEEQKFEIVKESLLTQQQRLYQRVDIMPAVDALLSSDQSMKRGAIQTLARIRTPESISWLLKARSHSDPDVRFYATQSLTQLKRDYEQQLKAIEEEVLENSAKFDLRLELARAQFEYAVSGLTHEARYQQLLKESQNWLSHSGIKSNEKLRLFYEIQKLIEPRSAIELIDQIVSIFPEEEEYWLKEKIQLQFKLTDYFETWQTIQLLKQLHPIEEFQEVNTQKDRDWDASLLWWSPNS